MPEDNLPKYKRRRYFVKKGFQVRYAVTILAWVFLAAVISYATLYHQFRSIIENLPLSPEYVDFVKEATRMAFFARLGILFLLALVAGILISHKIAGPLYRIEKNLREIIATGDLAWHVTLRRGDELEELAESLNVMTDGLKSIVEEDRKLLDEISSITMKLADDIQQRKVPVKDAIEINRKLNLVKEKLRLLTSRYKTE